MRNLSFELFDWVNDVLGGKFLTKEGDAARIAQLQQMTGSDAKVWWYEIDRLKAREKCAQVLRECMKSSNRI